MLSSLFGLRSAARKRVATAGRSPRLELLEPRLVLSGSPWHLALKVVMPPLVLPSALLRPRASQPATVTYPSGSSLAKSSIAPATSFDGIANPTLSSLVESLDHRDGSIDRGDMIQILQTAESLDGGAISQGVMTDLKTLLDDASELGIPGYVQVLAGDVINGNPANAHYRGRALGNLAVGSTGART